MLASTVLVALVLLETPAAPASPAGDDAAMVDASTPGVRIAATIGGALVGIVGGYAAATGVQVLATHGVCEFALDCPPAQGWTLMGLAFAATAIFPALGAWAGDRLAGGQANLGTMLLFTALTAAVGAALTVTGLLLPADQRAIAEGFVQAGGAIELLGSPAVAVVVAEHTHRAKFRALPAVSVAPVRGGAVVTAGLCW